MKRTTLSDVALRAGVSKQTVSNVLNGNPKMAAATRAVILDAIQELGYEANHAARSLRQRRTWTVAYVYKPDSTKFSDPYVSLVIGGVGEALRSAGYDLLTHPVVGGKPLILESLQTLLRQGRIDGAILFATTLPDELVNSLSGWPFPIVAFDHQSPEGGIPSVWVQYQETMIRAVRFLAERGRRKIAFLAGSASDPRSSATARLEGYRSGLRDVGLPFDPALVASGDWSYESGRACLGRLLGRSPDAVVAANDRMAVGVIQEAKARRLTVPGDLAVIGFDDFEFARFIDPPLTTFHLPLEAMTAQAVQLLLARIEGRAILPAEQRPIPAEFVMRKSA